MSFENTRKSKLAIVKQDAKGTPKLPSDGTTFIALQDGYSLNPTRETLDNNEMRGDISMAEKIPGVEGSEFSLDSYLKASGSEGVEADAGILLENLLGTKEVEATEYLTAAASTVSTIKLASGGSSLSSGQSIILKDATNGYSVRPIKAISTNDLTLGFNVASAPAAGIGIGKCVAYKPADTADYLTIVDYRGDGGIKQLASDVRIASGEITIEAGEAINMSFSGGGITGMYMNPIQITATNKYIDFVDGVTDLSAVLSEKVYRDVFELAAEAQTKMNALATANITVTYNNTGSNQGKFTFASDGATFSIEWLTGANTANTAAVAFGFSAAADSTGALTYSSVNQLTYTAPYTPSLDSTSPLIAKDCSFLLGGATETACRAGSSITISVNKELTNANSFCAPSGVADAIPTSREVTISGSLYFERHDLSMWEKYKNYSTESFYFIAGEKDSSGNRIPGKTISVYAPYMKLETFNFEDQDGIVVLSFEGSCFNPAGGIGQIFICNN
jgi:hypothetical protein